MRWRLNLVILLMVKSSYSQPLPSFRTLRYDENYTVLKNDSIGSFYRKLKYTALSADRNTFISFGGEARLQYIDYKNDQWSDAPQATHRDVLSRYLLHGNLHVGKYFRLFTELQSGLAVKKLKPAPVDDNSLELHQAFISSGTMLLLSQTPIYITSVCTSDKPHLMTDRAYDDNKLQTFNPLFPRGGYFGLAGLIGPENLIGIHPSISLNPFEALNISFDYDIMWRHSSNDGIYAPSNLLIYSGRNTSEKLVGNQSSIIFDYSLNRFLSFGSVFTWFNAGQYLKAVSPGRDVFFVGLTTQAKF